MGCLVHCRQSLCRPHHHSQLERDPRGLADINFGVSRALLAFDDIHPHAQLALSCPFRRQKQRTLLDGFEPMPPTATPGIAKPQVFEVYYRLAHWILSEKVVVVDCHLELRRTGQFGTEFVALTKVRLEGVSLIFLAALLHATERGDHVGISKAVIVLGHQAFSTDDIRANHHLLWL